MMEVLTAKRATSGPKPPSERTSTRHTRKSNELWLAAAGLAILTIVVYGRHIADGGFWFDDWRTVDALRTHGSLGTLGAGLRAEGLNGRPVQVLEIWVVGHLLGVHARGWLVYAALLGAMVSFALFGLLREAGTGRLSAAAAAVLALVFPFNDSLRLWPAAAQASFSLGVTLLGGWAGLRGLRSRGRAAVLWTSASCVAYAIGVLDYEHALAVIGVVGLAGFLVAPWRRALLSMAAQLAVGLGCLAFTLSTSSPDQQTTISGTVHHFGVMMGAAWELLGRSASPVETTWKLAAACVLLMVIGGIAALAVLPAEHAARQSIRRAFVLCAAGVLMILAGYALMSRASDWYSPLLTGQGNRTNAAAGIGWALLFVGLAGLAAALVLQVLWSASTRATAVGFGVLALTIAFSWVSKTNDDARDWDVASQIQTQVLNVLSASPQLAAAPAGAHLFLFGVPRATTPEVPIFIERNDLSAALRVVMHKNVIGLPVFLNASSSCGAHGPIVTGGWTESVTDARYGASYFLDWANQRVLPVPSRSACISLLRGLRPGPLSTTTYPATPATT